MCSAVLVSIEYFQPTVLTVPDLSTVPLDGTHLGATNVLLGAEIESHRATPLPRELVDECLPYFLSILVREIGVIELDVHARDEGIVKPTNPIRREEEDSVVAL